jgi:hypothetical protein
LKSSIIAFGGWNPALRWKRMRIEVLGAQQGAMQMQQHQIGTDVQANRQGLRPSGSRESGAVALEYPSGFCCLRSGRPQLRIGCPHITGESATILELVFVRNFGSSPDEFA